MGDSKGTKGPGTFGVHAPFRDNFTVKMGQFFQEPDILQQLRAAGAGGHRILIIGDGRPGNGGQLLFTFSFSFLYTIKNNILELFRKWRLRSLFLWHSWQIP